jgi:hypothetical protein
MPIELIPLTPPSMHSEELGLKGYSAMIIDGYLDENGNLLRRPGLTEFCDLATGAAVDALYWWQDQEECIAISDGEVYRITTIDGTFTQITAGSGDFEKGARATFADMGTIIFAANGGKIIGIPVSGGNTDTLTDTDAPTSVTHVTVLDRYLIANEKDTGNFHWSTVNAPLTWPAEQAEAEARKDDLVAMAMADLELYLMGKNSLEIWHDDGVTPFTRLYQGFIDSGTIAPYSFTRCQNTWFWLDLHRNVVSLNGRRAQPVSTAIGKYMDGLSQVTDCLGDFIIFNGRPFYILQFKTARKTFALDLSTGYWYIWGYWHDGEHLEWRGNCAAICPAWNTTLIGDHSNGKVYKLDSTNYQDDGNTLKTLVRTNHINRGTESIRKSCHKLTFRLKRSDVSETTGTKNIILRYRDNGSTTWTGERAVAIGKMGDTEFRAETHMLGSYYSRQWEFYIVDNAALTLVSVEESYT